jgi:SAM-dependent methyltransferase
MEARSTGRVRPAAFTEADVELDDTLDNLDGAVNYAGWIFELMEPHLGREILEVGAGNGTFTELLARRPGRVVASDLSMRRVEVMQKRFAGMTNVDVVHGDIAVTARHGNYDSAVLINVLEHIEDDDAALRQLREMLEPGGRLVVWVPAFEGLYSEFDRKVGHFRRYRLAGLQSQLREAGFEIVQIRYANAIGAIAWWLVARVLRRQPTARSSVRLFDRNVVPVVKYLESRRRPPFGQSIFAVAARSADSRTNE